MVVQWLRICTSTAGGTGSTPRTKIPHASRCGKKKKKNELSESCLISSQVMFPRPKAMGEFYSLSPNQPVVHSTMAGKQSENILGFVPETKRSLSQTCSWTLVTPA